MVILSPRKKPMRLRQRDVPVDVSSLGSVKMTAAAVIFTLPKDDTTTGTGRCLKRMGILRGDKITMRYKRLDMECTRTKKDTAIVVRRGLEQ